MGAGHRAETPASLEGCHQGAACTMWVAAKGTPSTPPPPGHSLSSSGLSLSARVLKPRPGGRATRARGIVVQKRCLLMIRAVDVSAGARDGCDGAGTASMSASAPGDDSAAKGAAAVGRVKTACSRRLLLRPHSTCTAPAHQLADSQNNRQAVDCNWHAAVAAHPSEKSARTCGHI